MRLILEEGVVIPEVIDHQKAAFLKANTEISYGEVVSSISSFAVLVDILPGEKVLLCSENRPEWAYALYGSWQRGGVVVPVDYMSSEEELLYITRETEPSVLFCSNQTEDRLEKVLRMSGLKANLYNFDRLITPKPIAKAMSRSLDETALILYTSGTTGQPKGVMLSFKNLLSNIRAIEKVGVATKEDVTLAILPFHHSYPLMVTLLVPLYLGATVGFLERLSSEELLRALRDYRVSILVGVPRLFQVLQQRIEEGIASNPLGSLLYRFAPHIPFSLRSLVFRRVHQALGGHIRFLVSGGAKLPPEVYKTFHMLGFRILEGYGLTETSPIVSFNPPQKPKLGSVGLPIDDVRVIIAEDGEVLVRGVNVMQGYYKKPEDSARAFRDGWLLTGDLGYLDDEGYLYITGRKKEILVLSGGKKVNPEELEAMLLKESQEIKESAVLEVDGSVKAIIVPDVDRLKQRGVLNIEDFVRWQVVDRVNQKLPEWKRITGFKVLKDELPKTRLGKLRRFMLPQLYLSGGESQHEDRQDQLLSTPEGQLISSYLQKLTKRSVKGSHHLELDLGLDSLQKIELWSFLELTFGLELSEEDLLQHSTLQELVDFVIQKRERMELRELGWREVLLQAQPYKLEDHRLAFGTGRLLLRLFFSLYNRLRVEGVENLPEPPFILAPNHASYLDGFVLASSLPSHIAQKTYFLGAEEYFRGRLSSTFGRLAHVITVNLNRKLKESLQKTAWALRLGKAVVIFPEGARTRDGKLMPFRKGFAILSRELEVPIVPVAIKGTYESMSVYDRFPKPARIKVKFGEVIHPQGKSYEQILEETRSSLQNMLSE